MRACVAIVLGICALIGFNMATPGIVHRPPKRAEVEVSSTLEPRALKLTTSGTCACVQTLSHV